jgi:S1-C subfamily serine protease
MPCSLYRCLLLVATLLVAITTRAEVDYLTFATEDEANTTEIFARASPSVVYVTNTALRRSLFSLNVQEIPRGSGTGFVWEENGLIVTNFHVIAGAHKLTVTLQDQTEHAAEVIGVAPEKDLAVLLISEPPDNLASLPMGDSSELSVGRKVLAIGNPFGLDTINPGNSGGPLLNSLGQLVGVHTAIYSPSGASAGIGFAIPVNTVKDVVPQLISYGRILRPIIGVELASDRWIQRYRISGVPVVHVQPGMPADRAGMKAARRVNTREIELGDVIIEVDGRRVRSNDDFLTALERKEPGEIATIKTRRGEEEFSYDVELIESQ